MQIKTQVKSINNKFFNTIKSLFGVGEYDTDHGKTNDSRIYQLITNNLIKVVQKNDILMLNHLVNTLNPATLGSFFRLCLHVAFNQNDDDKREVFKFTPKYSLKDLKIARLSHDKVWQEHFEYNQLCGLLTKVKFRVNQEEKEQIKMSIGDGDGDYMGNLLKLMVKDLKAV